MGRSSAALVLAVALASSCGGEEERGATTHLPARTTPVPKQECTPASARGFRVCAHVYGAPPTTPATIQRREGTGWRVLVAGPPRSVHDGLQVGHWADAWLSPDGETLLAQWSAECEIPIAFFVDLTTRSMRPVTGEKRWTNAPESIALGWSGDGRARVRLTKGYCGGSKHPPGVYLVDPATHGLARLGR
jgi:hypothetical protein